MARREPNPIIEEEAASDSFFTNSRCCFCFPSSSSSSSPGSCSWWQRIRSPSRQNGEGSFSRSFWSRGVQAFKKIREWSEIVAGPKWKTFIRRFNRNSRHMTSTKFQYDPLSYSLNFDEGHGAQGRDFDDLDDYGGFHDFSSRYALASASSQSDQARRSEEIARIA